MVWRRDDAVTRAMRDVPRVDFLPADQRQRAGKDGPLPLGDGQTSSQPRTVAAMLRLLEVQPGHRVLDVGAGSGWTTALLGELVGSSGAVVGVELLPRLARWAAGNVAAYDMDWAQVFKGIPRRCRGWRRCTEGTASSTGGRAGRSGATSAVGKALPFKATGKDELVIDAKAHHVGVYMGMDVDRNGNIYIVNAKSELDVYDADGNLYKKGLLKLNGAVRGIQVDGEGNVYTLSRQPADLVSDTILEVYKAPLLVLCKYGPEGGKPLWASPWTGITGRDQVLVWGCGCLRPRLHQAMDDKGYLFVAAWHSVRVIEAKTGKVVGEFGSYGNMDCRGKGSAYPHPELPFGTISAIAVWKDKLFAMDQLNRRIVKCRIVYR